MPEPPRVERSGRGSLQVVVNADGTVNPELTRAWTATGDREWNEALMGAVRSWRYTPAVRNQVPVRSGFRLDVASETRVDTLPARLEWRYSTGIAGDSLVGRWIPLEAPPALTAAEVDSIHMAVVRHLHTSRVLEAQRYGVPRYCIVSDRDSAAHVRFARSVHGFLSAGTYLSPAEPGCEREVENRRLLLPRPHLTENGRVVIYVEGDHLPDWPPGFDGRNYRAWKSRCILDLKRAGPSGGEDVVDATDRVHCTTLPIFSVLEHREQRRPRLLRTPGLQEGDSVELTLMATTLEAAQMDTFRAKVGQLSRLTERAIVQADPPCGPWSAWSVQSAAELYIVKGDLAGAGAYVTRVREGAAPRDTTPAPCPPQQPREAELVLFTLGDLGDPVTAPITVCIGGRACANRYVIPPGRNLADRAHFRFRRSDLRELTRSGGSVIFRIYADPFPPDLTPLILVRVAGRWSVSHPREISPGEWQHHVTYVGNGTDDPEFRVYLITR